MEKEVITGMIWTEKKYHDTFDYINNRFKEKYTYKTIDDIVYFYLPDGLTMKVVPLSFDSQICFVMSYKGNGYDDDGDQYYIDDYASLDELFTDMLRETKS